MALGVALSDIERRWLIKVREDHGLAGAEYFNLSHDERQRLRDILKRSPRYG